MFQFVPIRDFINKGGVNPMMVQALLAKEVLAEVPEQFLSFMNKHGVQPSPARQHQQSMQQTPNMAFGGGAGMSYPPGGDAYSLKGTNDNASAPAPSYSDVIPPPYYG